MQISFQKSNLIQVLEYVSKVTPKKHINPVLENVLFKVTNQNLSVLATDSEMFCSFKVPCETSSVEGEFLLPLAMVKETVQHMEEGQIRFSFENQSLLISQNGASAKIQLFEPENFPSFPEIPEKMNLHVLEGKVLSEFLNKTLPFASKNELRTTFYSVLLEKKDLTLQAISSDTKRLAIASQEGAEGEDFSFLLPRKSAEVLAASVMNQGSVEFMNVDKQMFFFLAQGTLIFNRLEDSFPAYEDVIPKQTSYLLTVDRSLFLKTLDFIRPYSSQSISNRLYLNLQNNKMECVSEEMEKGQAKKEIEVEYDGAPLSIAFNLDFIREIIFQVEKESVLIKIVDEKVPVVILGKESQRFKFILVPSNLN